MSSDRSIIVETRNNKRIIRFCRPAARNPLCVETLDRLAFEIDAVRADATLTSLIFTGTDDVFASGANIRQIAELDSDTARPFAARGQDLINGIATLRMVTIAAINGYCFGGALDLAVACRHRIASPNAQFAHPGVSLGIITGWGGTQRLPRLIGETPTLEMLLTAGRFDAEWALRRGLVDEIADDPLEYALDIEPQK